MKTYLDCVPCFLRQALDATRLVSGDDELAERVLRRVLEATHFIRLDLPPPFMGRKIHRIIREVTGSSDPYSDIKRQSTNVALQLVDRVERAIEVAAEPFEAAVRFSIAGNVMDYALASRWDAEKIEVCLDEALGKPMDTAVIRSLEEVVREADSILMIGDNAGETVFDRILIQQLPAGKVTYAVKGSPVINDATLEDARMAGITDLVRVVENGADAPGTILDLCSQDFRQLFFAADVVISKGQANLETLYGCERDVFFLTQIKCPVIARDVDAEVGQWLARRWQPAELVPSSSMPEAAAKSS